MLCPGFSPLRRQAQHEFEIFPSTEAPAIPWAVTGPGSGAWESLSAQNSAAATASTETGHGSKQAIAAIGPTGSPGKVVGFAADKGLKGVKPWPWALVASNRLLFQREWKGLCAGERCVLQECQAKSAQSMGAAAHQQITRLGLCSMQSQRSDPCKRTDGEQSLVAGAAVTSQQSSTKVLESF